MSIPGQPIDYKDLSGGMTDNLITGAKTQGEAVENFFITTDKKLLQRPGSEIVDSDVVNLVAPAGPTGNLFNFNLDTTLLIRTGTKLFVKPASTWAELTGPNGGSLFATTPALSERSVATAIDWQNQMILTGYDSDPDNNPLTQDLTFASPQKVYRDKNGAYKLLNAGMRDFPDNRQNADYARILADSIALAKDLKTNFNAHFSSVNPTGALGSNAAHYLQSETVTSPNPTDLDSLIIITRELMARYTSHVRNARTTVTGGPPPQGAHYIPPGTTVSLNFDLPYIGDPDTLLLCAQNLNNLYTHFQYHLHSYSSNAGALTNSGYLVPMTSLHQKDTGYTGTFGSPTQVSLDPYPIFNSVTTNFPTPDANRLSVVYRMMDYASSMIRAHFTNQGQNQHPVQFTAFTNSRPGNLPNPMLSFNGSTASDMDLVIQLCIALDAYDCHRRDQNYFHTNASFGSESPATESLYNFTQVGESGRITAPSTKTLAGVQEIHDAILDLHGKMIAHKLLNARHTVTAAFDAVYPAAITSITFKQYAYAFIYSNTYTTLGGTIFKNVGAPLYSDPVVFPDVITASASGVGRFFWPTVRNTVRYVDVIQALSASENWPTSTSLTEIYRTKDAGTVYYKIASLSATTLSFFSDQVNDTNLVEPIYTTGGVARFTQPPKCLAVFLTNNTGYYAGTLESVDGQSQFMSRRIRQSIPGAVEAVPDSFYVDLESDFVCGGSAHSVPVAVGKKGVYRLEGTFSETGDGGITAITISETVGGASQNGGATLHDIYYFAGDTGIFMTDGYKVQRITYHLAKSYKKCVETDAKKRQIQATVDKVNNRILFTMNEGSSGYCDTVWALDLNQPIEPVDEHNAIASFTKLSNGTQFAPTSLTVFGGVIHRGDSQGFVFKHTENLTSDPLINRGSGSLYAGETCYIPFRWKSIADSYDFLGLIKWIPKASFVFANLGALSVQPRSYNNKAAAGKKTRKIQVPNTYVGDIKEMVKMPAGHLRSIFKQLEISPALDLVSDSTDPLVATLGTVTGNSLLTLDTSPYDFPLDIRGAFVSFSGDGYTAQYPVVSRGSGDTVTLSGNPPNGVSLNWRLLAYPKNQVCHFLGMTVWAGPLSPTLGSSPDV